MDLCRAAGKPVRLKISEIKDHYLLQEVMYGF